MLVFLFSFSAKFQVILSSVSFNHKFFAGSLSCPTLSAHVIAR